MIDWIRQVGPTIADNLGLALIEGTLITAAAALITVQINAERLPHKLFREASTDKELYATLLIALFLSVVVKSTSALTELSDLGVAATAACVIVATLFTIIALFRSYRRALTLTNPSFHIERILEKTKALIEGGSPRPSRSDKARKADDDERGSRREETTPTGTSNLTSEPRQAVQHLTKISNRSAARGDHEVAKEALRAIVGINSTHVNNDGRRIHAEARSTQILYQPDALIEETISSMRAIAEKAILQRDEDYARYTMETLQELVSVYSGITYEPPRVEKFHALVITSYLEELARKAATQETSVYLLASIQQILGRTAEVLIDAGNPEPIESLSRTIWALSRKNEPTDGHHLLTRQGIRELSNLTIRLLRSRSVDMIYAIKTVTEQTFRIARAAAGRRDTSTGETHHVALTEYFQSDIPDGLPTNLAKIARELSGAQPDDRYAQTILGHTKQWAESARHEAREFLRQTIETEDPFTVDLLKWIQRIAQIFATISQGQHCNTPQAEDFLKQSHSMLSMPTELAATIEHIDVGTAHALTNSLFETAQHYARPPTDETALATARLDLLTWSFTGGENANNGEITGRALIASAIVALPSGEEATARLKQEARRRLCQEHRPRRKVLDEAVAYLEKEAQTIGVKRFPESTLDWSIGTSTASELAPLLQEIVQILSEEGPKT